MKKNFKNRKMIISLFLVAMVIFLTNNLVVSAESDSLTLGKFDFKTETFIDTYATGNNLYRSILIAYGNDKGATEELELPTVDGFTKSADASTNYSTVINMPNGKSPQEIADYVKEIKFKNSSDGQTIRIVISDMVINDKTFYYSANQHYYQYIKYTDIGTSSSNPKNHSWVDAYNLTKNLTYGGRQGYLATITSFEEDLFIYNASNSIGWLGGTVLTHGDTEGSLYYSSFNKNSGANTWYWAAGPERGQVFFKGKGSGAYQSNDNAGYYFNWASGEPNKSKFGQESCLTSLRTGVGYAAKKAGSSIPSSWNDAPENSQSFHSKYGVKGYFVEYGDQTIGDSGTNNENNIISSSVITYPSTKQKEGEFLIYDGTEKKPTIMVKDGDHTLNQDIDYEIEYIGVNLTSFGPSAIAPKEVGTYKAIIKFKGNYDGIEKEVPFYIINKSSIIISNQMKLNVYNAKIENNSEEIFDKLNITDDDLKVLGNNKNIFLYLEIRDITDSVSDSDINIVKNLLTEDIKIGKYFDINLLKKIDGEEEEQKITKLNKPITISFTIPDELLNTNLKTNRTFIIYAIHDNDVTNTNVNVNGNIGTFEADRFSTYVLTYTDTNSINNPPTGDNVIYYILMLGLSALGLVGTFTHLKKRFN